MSITKNFQKIREAVPPHVTIVLAVKQRTISEIKEVLQAGATDLGENYLQETEEIYQQLATEKITWHLIGHLQSNKITKAIKLFNLIQTVDSLAKAQVINQAAQKINQVISVLIEVNIGKEENKNGVYLEEAEPLAKEITKLKNIKLEGLMTMAPYTADPDQSRPYFQQMKQLFDNLNHHGIKLTTLSMGMSDSYQVAIEEGSTMIRVGTAIFGPRIKVINHN